MITVAPGVSVRDEIDRLLRDGVPEKQDVVGTFLRLGARQLAEELLQIDAIDVLKPDANVCHPEDEAYRGHPNGDKPALNGATNGTVLFSRARQMRAPSVSRLASFLRTHAAGLERLAAVMYARGPTTRDVEETLRDVRGTCSVDVDAVSALAARLRDDAKVFAARDLSCFTVEYLFLDVVYESLRTAGGGHASVLCAWGILADGRKVLLHLTLGNKDKLGSWLGMLRNLRARGLRAPGTVVGDHVPGLLRAIEQTWPDNPQIRDWIHL
jgi:transposase-like protein